MANAGDVGRDVERRGRQSAVFVKLKGGETDVLQT